MSRGRQFLLALALSVLACRRVHPGPPPSLPVWTGGDAGVAPPLPSRSPGCDRADVPTGDLVRAVTVAGYERRYRMFVPAGPPARPLPVVFYFNGKGHYSPILPEPPALPRWALASGLADLTEVASGAIFVVPRGTRFPPDHSVGWYSGCPSDDVDFFDKMLAAIGDSHCIDPRKVLVGGFSWGSEMSLALACCRGDKIRAVVAASGAHLESMPRCPATRLPALRASYDVDGDPFYSREELAGAVAFFRRAHHCAAESDPVDAAPCVAYRGCDAPVVDCAYRGLGHNPPPGFARRTWAFFAGLTAGDRP
jgi:poly(3-hydroxybutyrate) depolymerase